MIDSIFIIIQSPFLIYTRFPFLHSIPFIFKMQALLFFPCIIFVSMIGQRIVREEQQKMVKKIKHYIYDPQQVIGSGFSSKVFKGVNELTQQTIAIKVLELNKIQSEVEKYLLNNQINALRALSHPHILRTVQILMTKNNVYIMTEFCDGGDLQQHVKKQGRLTQLEALHLARDITDGYLAIEEKLIVHRDLKTANIFLTSTGARIADFGFCEFLNQTKKPQLFYNVGSPAYMSPESYRENIYSAKSDIWSIGIILYEMLIGETPDKNLTYSEMSNSLMAGRIASGPNEEIRHMLSLCFKRDLKQRITTLQLLEMINNQILRLEGGPRGIRSQAGQQNNQPRLVSSNSMHPLDITPIRTSNNRHMVASNIPTHDQNQPAFRGPSPLKARFNGIMAREQTGRNLDPSPVKFIDRRFSRQDEPPQRFNRIKSVTEMLLFLYRLLNSLGQVSLQRVSMMRLVLFRHRNFLEQQAERIAQEDHLDRATFEPLKEFHFLKGRFDDAYLQKEVQQTPSQLSATAIRLQQLSNAPFVQPKPTEFYCGFTLEVANECENRLMTTDESQTNRIGVILDYLLLHYQILDLYAEGKPLDAIVQQYMQLPALLKDQPKRITPFHLALLRHKLRMACKHLEETTTQEKMEIEDSPGYKQLADIPQRKALMINGFF